MTPDPVPATADSAASRAEPGIPDTSSPAVGGPDETVPAPAAPSGGRPDASAPSPPSGPGPEPDAAGDQLTRVALQLAAVVPNLEALLKDFESKLLHDQGRAREIARLSAELDACRPDAVWRTVLPLIKALIRHHRLIGQFLEHYGPAGKSSSPGVVDDLRWLQEDVETALQEHEVGMFRPIAGEDRFDGRRHTMVGRPVPTDDERLSRVVETCLGPGFDRGGTVVERARVRIFRCRSEPAPPAGGVQTKESVRTR